VSREQGPPSIGSPPQTQTHSARVVANFGARCSELGIAGVAYTLDDELHIVEPPSGEDCVEAVVVGCSSPVWLGESRVGFLYVASRREGPVYRFRSVDIRSDTSVEYDLPP